MGRGFSTFYRITLMAMSLTALILSALSATSCSFLKFDHQYGGGRSLASLSADTPQSIENDDSRKLPQSSAIPDEDGVPATTTTLPTIAWFSDDSKNGTTSSASGTTTHASSPSSSSSSSSAHSPAASPSSHQSSHMPTHKSSHKNNSSGSSSSSASGQTTTSTTAAAQVTGESGLFCDSETSFFVSNLWGESSVSDFESKIATESNDDQSEEIARNAVVAALVIGTITLFVMLLECILGWRMWCDKVLVGLLAFMACVSQGITFLFFDSDRYCDGDLVNEIINAKPCTLGKGGVYSVVAVIMYAVMIIMACRLPKDDPYGLCCKKRRGNSGNESTSTTGGQFGLLGSKESGSDNGNTRTEMNDVQEGERPNWVSEEKRRDVEENEII